MARVGQVEALEIEFHPFELRPEGAPPIDLNSAYIQNAWRDSIKPMALDLGVEMNRPTMSPNTRLAHEAAEYALLLGKQEEMSKALLKGYFQDGRDIGQVEVICDIALGVGIDPVAMRVCLDERQMAAVVEEKLAAAHDQYRITAVPTFVIGNRYLLRGLVPESELQRVINMVKGEGLIQLD